MKYFVGDAEYVFLYISKETFITWWPNYLKNVSLWW
jgi:hypothetical protein